jgi:hypothetical protein
MNEETLLRNALDKPPAERTAFLDAACAGKPDLRATVLALLATREATGGFLDLPGGDIGATIESKCCRLCWGLSALPRG